MSDVSEFLGYNRHGLRYMTPRDVRELRRRVASHDWSPNLKNNKPRPIDRIVFHLARTVTNNQTRG